MPSNRKTTMHGFALVRLDGLHKRRSYYTEETSVVEVGGKNTVQTNSFFQTNPDFARSFKSSNDANVVRLNIRTTNPHWQLVVIEHAWQEPVESSLRLELAFAIQDPCGILHVELANAVLELVSSRTDVECVVLTSEIRALCHKYARRKEK